MTTSQKVPSDLYKKIRLGRKVLWALVLGAATGILLQQLPSEVSLWVLPLVGLGATLFLELLKMLVIPLIITAIFTGVVQTGAWRSLRVIGYRSFLYFAGSSLIAVLIGLVLVNLVPIPLMQVDSVLERAAELTSSATEAVEQNRATALFFRLVPSYPLDALATSDILGFILFTGLFAYFTSQIGSPHRARISHFVQSCDRVVHKVAYAVISLDPYGVFCLMTLSTAKIGWGDIQPLAGFLATILVAFALFFFVALPALLWYYTRRNPFTLMRQVSPALITAFSTTSSTATLPLTIECAVHFGRLSPRISSIVLPLGAHLNVCGRALFEGVTVVFIARSVGFELSWWQEAQVLLASLAVSVGGSGFPHLGLQILGSILQVVGLPMRLAGFIVGVDKLVAMVSSATTVWSNVVGAAIVEQGIKQKQIDVNIEPVEKEKEDL